MSDELTQALVGLVLALVSAFIPVVAFYGRQYAQQLIAGAEARLGAERMEQLLTMAEIFIRAAEQSFVMEHGEEKEQFVVAKLMVLVKRHDLPLTHDDVTAVVRGLFNSLKPEMRGGERPLRTDFLEGLKQISG